MSAHESAPSTAKDPAGPQRIEFATEDEDQARQVLDAVYGARLQINASRFDNWSMSLGTVDVGPFSVGDVALPADLTFELDEHSDVVVATCTAGLVECTRGKQLDQYQPGDVYIGAHPHGRHGVYRCLKTSSHAITLPQAVLVDVAHGGTAPVRPWQFTNFRTQRQEQRPVAPSDHIRG